MTTLTIWIVAVFILGYFFIAIESVTKVNKAALLPHGSDDYCGDG